jgi:hypothetical protein
VRPGWVLTSAHVVRNASAVRVWLGAPAQLAPEAGLSVDPGSILRVPSADLALLPLEQSPSRPSGGVLLGRLDRSATEAAPAVASGFPRFKLRPRPDDSHILLRDVHYAMGRIAAGSNAKTGTLELAVEVEPAEDPDEPQRSPWESMSGAPVFVSGRLIGVVGQHYPLESRRVLTVRPLTALYASAGAESARTRKLARWRTAIPQLGATAADLAIASAPEPRALAASRAQRAAANIAPPVLVAREEELARLAGFAVSADRWLWLQGAAFAGKTALLAWFAIRPPPEAEVAACFLRRTTDADTAEYALDVLNSQLASYAERSYQSASHPSQQLDDFTELLPAAAQACEDRGRRLVVLIDGLDEDQTVAPGLAVASWLPAPGSLPANAALLVASRTGLDAGIAAGHPLASHVWQLSASDAASEIELQAELELRLALSAPDPVPDLLGLIAAAYGGLSTPEIAGLLRERGRPKLLNATVAEMLRTRVARCISRQADPDDPGRDVHSYAHLELLQQARAHFRGDLARLRADILSWCHTAAQRAATPDHVAQGGRAAPDGVPVYALQHYADHLAGATAWTDWWNDLMRSSWAAERDLAAAQYLPYRRDLELLIAAAQRVSREAVGAGHPSPAIAAAVAGTVALAGVESQLAATSPELAAAWVQGRHWSGGRALRYLASIKERDQRALAIGTVAPVLGPDTVAAVLELYQGLAGPSDDERGAAAFGVARLLAAAGQGSAAAALAEAEAAAARPCEACSAAAGALTGLSTARAGALLARIREWSVGLGGYDRLWNFVERLAGSLTRQQAERMLAAMMPASDPADYILGLLAVPEDDIQNRVSALLIAAPWLSRAQLAERGRALLAEIGTGPSDGGYELAELARVAPAELHQEILRRAESVTGSYRIQIVAGLLGRADKATASALQAELPRDTRLLTLSSARTDFLADVAAAGQGALAIKYLRTAEHLMPDDVAAVTRQLEPGLLPELLQLTATMDPALAGTAQAAVRAALERAGQHSGAAAVVPGPSADAARLAVIGMGWLSTDAPASLPASAHFRLAATLIGAGDGIIPSERAIKVLADLPPPWVVLGLTEKMPSLPIEEDSVDDLVELCLSFRTWVASVKITRLIKAVLLAVSRQFGVHAAALAGPHGPWLSAQLVAACGGQLIAAGADRQLLLRSVGDPDADLIRRAALAEYADSPAEEIGQIAALVAGHGLFLGYAPDLDVLEALPESLRPLLIEQALPAGFLARSGPPSLQGDLWADTLTDLAFAFGRDQLRTVERAIAASNDIGSTGRSTLWAEIAIRWAHLGDFAAFRSAVDRIPYTDAAAMALAGSVLHVPAEHLTGWYAMTRRLEPRLWPDLRALIWAFARDRWPEQDRAAAWRVLENWLPGPGGQGAAFDEPWQALVDLVGHAPAIAMTGAPEAMSQLRDLLVSARLLDPWAAPQAAAPGHIILRT